MALTTSLRGRVAHRVVRVLARTTYRLHDRSLPVQERGWRQHDGAAVHELEVHEAGAAAGLERVYRESLFVQSVPARFLAAYPDPGGPPGLNWILDSRVALARSDLLRPVASAMADILDHHGVRQIAGQGYGSFLLIGAILMADDRLRAGLVRETRKDHGTHRLVEGSLEASQPTFIIDDVLSGGRSAGALTRTLRAEGHHVHGALFVFRYGDRTGTARLQHLDLTIQALATLHLLRER